MYYFTLNAIDWARGRVGGKENDYCYSGNVHLCLYHNKVRKFSNQTLDKNVYMK